MSNNPSKISVAKMQVADLDAVVRLEQESGLSSWGITGYAGELLNPDAVLLVAYDLSSESLRGFFAGHVAADEFEVFSIAVRFDSRNLGIGSTLLAAGEQEMQARGLRRGWLEVRSMNKIAIMLYEKFGFQLVGRRRNYYVNPVDDALIMRWEK